MLACRRMLRLLLAQNPFIFRVRYSARPGLAARIGAPELPHGNERLAKGGKPVFATAGRF